jgi:hypothetical protein
VQCSTNSIFSSCAISFSPVSNRLGRQLGHAQKIVRSPYPPSSELGSLGSSKACFSKPSYRLDPTKDLFDSFSNPLTQAVALMAHGAAVDRRSTPSSGVGSHVGDDLSAAQKTDKVAGVVPLIGPQTFYFDSLASLTLDHVLGRFPLRAPRGLTHQKIDQQPISVLHQGMRPVTKLSLFTRPFAHQKTVRIGARLMGVVAALLTVKIHPAVAPIARIVISRSFFTLGPRGKAN